MKPATYTLTTQRSADAAIAAIGIIVKSLPQVVIMEVIIREHRSSRSLAQNRLMWSWNRQIATHLEETMGEIHSDEAIHAYLKQTFLPMQVAKIRGEVVRERKSTAKLNTKEMSEYMEKVDMWASRDLGLVLDHPDDVYHQAMGEKR